MNTKKIFAVAIGIALAAPLGVLAGSSFDQFGTTQSYTDSQTTGAPTAVTNTGTAVTNTGTPVTPTPTPTPTPTTGAVTSATVPSLTNPLKDVNNIADLIYKIVQVLVDISYIVVAFFLILSGFKFVTAQGSDSKLSEAKTTFKYTLIGAFLVIGAQVIISVLKSIVAGLN